MPDWVEAKVCSGPYGRIFRFGSGRPHDEDRGVRRADRGAVRLTPQVRHRRIS